MNKQKYLISLLFILILVGCGKTLIKQPSPYAQELGVSKEYQKEFESALNLAGDNKEQLISAMKSATPEMRDGLAFIISTMPYPDLVAIKSDVLLEHIKYAYLAKNKYPWMKNMPEEIFLHYVLPYRCAQEPIEAYRKYFYEQLDPIVSQLDNLTDVVYQVNLWLGSAKADGKKRVRFVPTEARDQGPIETLKSGYGRCEEMMIVYMAAARSVGVPCRSAWTPYWAICDNNHAWVEVWIDGYLPDGIPGQAGWKPIGGCEPSVAPWFEHPSKRAAAVYSAAIGQPKSELIYKTSGNSSIINSTPNYSKTCKVNVKVVSQEGKTITGMNVVFSVFNWGSFRPFASKTTNSEGIAEFITGIGEYFLSSGKDNFCVWQVVKTEPDKTLDITMTLANDIAPDGFLFLRYPSLEQAKMSFQIPNIVPTYMTPITPTRQPPPEIYDLEEFITETNSSLMELINKSKESAAIVQKLKSASGNWHQIADAILEIAPEQRADLFYLITQLVHLESLEVTKEFLLEHVNYSTIARQKAKWQTSDDTYRPYVLVPTFQDVHLSTWRKELYEAFIPLMQDSVTETARAINNWVRQNIKPRDDLGNYFSNLTGPLDTFRSKQGNKYAVAVFTAAALRALSIPAKVQNDWVEFYNDTSWLPLYPHDIKNFANPQRDEQTQLKYSVKPGGLKLNIIRKGLVDSNPWEKVAVSRFQNGYWQFLDWSTVKRYGKWVVLEPGQYLITAGVRNANGDAMVYCKQLNFSSDQGITIDLPLDIPLNALPENERVVRRLKEIPSFELQDLDGNIYNLKNILKTNPVLLTFFSLDNEPSIRMLPLIEQTKEKAKGINALILTVYVDKEGKTKFLSDNRLKSVQLPILLDSTNEVVKQFIPEFEKNKNECLPSTLLISKEGKILIWDEGYNMAIDNLIESAFAGLPDWISGQAGLSAQPITSTGSAMPEPKISYGSFTVGPDYVGEGERYSKEGNYPKAIESYKEALNLNPDDANIWYNLACAYSLAGQINEGLEAVKKSLEYGWSDLYWMDNDPDLAWLRNDPGYKEIRK
ncbi:MAG: transglutaminase domain-containing protein [Planctomycetota bacterium]